MYKKETNHRANDEMHLITKSVVIAQRWRRRRTTSFDHENHGDHTDEDWQSQRGDQCVGDERLGGIRFQIVQRRGELHESVITLSEES